jgi:AcrR family transcriptional regulator
MSIRTSAARRERTREHARRDILESDARVFARRGYAAATLAELGQAAGYAAPSLYRYFGSKEEIFQSLLELVLAEVQEAFQAPVDRSLPLPERLSDLLVSLRRLAERRGETLDLLAAHGAPDERQAQLEKLIATWLRKHVGRSELRVAPGLAARVAAGILIALHHRQDRTGSAAVLSVQAVADLLLHGVSA